MINFKFSTENMQSLQEIILLIDSAIKVDANNLITG
jgi:hypothetical protein